MKILLKSEDERYKFETSIIILEVS